jgi:hypothetical protein
MSYERIILGVAVVFVCACAGICFGEPVIVVEPNELEFTAYDTDPNVQFLYICNGGDGVLNWEISESCIWLTVEPRWGSSTGEYDEVELSVDITGLAPGGYDCELVVYEDDPNTIIEPQQIDVHLDVIIGVPLLDLSANNIEFTALEGGSKPENQFLTIKNDGGGVLKWEIETSGSCDWISVGDTSGSLEPDEDKQILLNVNTSGLSGGEYVCELFVSAPGAENEPQIVTVRLDVIGPILEVFPLEVEFVASEGGTNPLDQILTIRNLGGGILNWTIETSGSCDWLSIGSLSGSLGIGEDEEIVLGADITDLGVGEYFCEMLISAAGAGNEPEWVETVLYIRPEDGIFYVPEKFSLIQSAINAAIDGDTIIVDIGTYVENINFGGKDIRLTSINTDDPNIVNSTIIDGGCNGSVVTFTGSETANCVLTGFTITNGSGTLGEYDYLYGGGIYGNDTLAVISNCLIKDNNASCGGGLYNHDGKLSNCKVMSNMATRYGGGLAYNGGEVINCIIVNNTAIFGGGGLYRNWGDINNCIITDNTAQDGGGLHGGYRPIINCTISGNTASSRGGGLHGCYSTIINCTISGNTAGSRGGGLSLNYGDISDCIITDNISSEYGGGLSSCGGTISNCKITGNSIVKFGGGLSSCSGTISKCIISENTAVGSGGGLWNCDGTISNCIVSENTAGSNGGGLASFDGTMTNCTIVENSANLLGGGIYCNYKDPTLNNCILWNNYPEEIYLEHIYANVTYLTYCDIEGGWAEESNIDVDPMFVDATNGDYHLMWDSPCVDAGDPEFVGEVDEVDIDGEPRLVGGRVDMGADEVGEKQADFTRDGRIDISDLSVLSGSWETQEGGERWYVLSDLFEDGVIGFDDLVLFVGDWMWQAEWAE